jgi:DNA repair exonuclease SbcCD ATPase subunit
MVTRRTSDMAFKLTKDERADLADHLGTLQEKLQKIREAEAARLETITAEDEKVKAAIADYNGALADAKTFVEETAERLRGEYDEKSERWQEGDKGSAASEFIEQWENVDMEDIDESETIQPDEISADHCEALEGLPEESEG